ncbi:glycosyltransferase family protein [Marivivens aquimaris]|uniref:hypothetical protein n=1 Tax=Marivivens aquimaris TaxID=2774876 RepID=UPI0018820F7D|nr:hypothetical protein [Marivivens aquimaris]
MNAAYKYWDRTGNYPHIYACLDPVVVKQHREAIERLLDEPSISEFFLHEAIFEELPHLRGHPKITARDEFMSRTGAIPVSSMSNYKQTTGVLATRFCIEKGFHELCLLGIDCNYVERLSQSEAGEGHELTIKGDVKRNPNYFFDNYQENNEKYQVPNPQIHSGNLHLQSFVALRDDIARSSAKVEITVGSRTSLLSRFNIFPYEDVYETLGLRRLSAIAVPLMPHELDGFLERLQTWVDPKLVPSFNAVSGVALHVFMSCATDVEIEEKIRERAKQLPWLARYFKKLRVTFLKLDPKIDYYVRGNSLNLFCNKSGPNIFWLSMMACCRDYENTLLLEADCVPVRAGWLDALERAVADCPPGTWVIGANYHGPTMTAPVNGFHINGNAIYATGDREFQDYLNGDFLRTLKWLAENVSNSVAYDVAFSLGMHNYQEIQKQIGVNLRKYAWRYTFTPVIRNISGQIETETAGTVDIMQEVRDDVSMYLCHGQPALRWLETEFANLNSFYAEGDEAVREIRVNSVGSLTKFVTWKNLGFGQAQATLHEGQAQWPDEIKVHIGGNIAPSNNGILELNFILPTSLDFKHVNAISVLESGEKSTLEFELMRSAQTVTMRLISINAASLKDVSLEITLSIKDKSASIRHEVAGLRFLQYPANSAPLELVATSKKQEAADLEDTWGEWIGRNQSELQKRYAFIECVQESVAPTLKDITTTGPHTFVDGFLAVPVANDSKVRLRFGTRPNRKNQQDVKLAVTLTAETDCDVVLGGKAFGYSIVEQKRTLRALEQTEIPLEFLLSPAHSTDFFVSVEIHAACQDTSMPTPKLRIEKIKILQTPQFTTPPKPTRFISVNPDAESFFGHFLNYEARLGRALRNNGQPHLIAGPIDAEPKVYEAHPEMAKVFSCRTNTLYSKSAGKAVAGLDTFATELDSYLSSLDHSVPSQLFMYCGSLEIAGVLENLAHKYPSCTFAISLYYLSWLDLTDNGLQNYWKPRLAKMSANPQIRLIVPSPELAKEMRKGFDVKTEVLPHPTTTFHDDEIGKLNAGGGEDGRKTVVFPGNLRGGKGFDLTKEALLQLIEGGVEDLRLRVRFPPADSVNKSRQAFFDQIRDHVEIMDSYLSEDEFRDLLLSADLVALPYTPDRFSNRTSGLLIDSLLLGVPSVVIDDTWLAGKVRELGFGEVVEEDGKALTDGIRAAVANLSDLKKAALTARDTYVQENSWDALVSFLKQAKPAVKLPQASSSQDSEASNRRLLIIGNGPSARLLAEAGFDKLPEGMDTWGTTAAYRYFEKENWWPTYYALADRKVVYHHRENFARLLDDPKVTTKKFFFSWKVSDSPRMELIAHSSTGSFSLKKAIELGYREIYLIGMEGAYVEEILESRFLTPEEIEERGFGVLNLSPAESKLLIIDQDPTYNPNYFFSGYQLKGDVYSLPQAHTHQANWDGVKSVAAEAGASVINLSKISKIDAFERRDIRSVFPYLPENCWSDFPDPFSDKAQHAKSLHEIVTRGFEKVDVDRWALALENAHGAVLRAKFTRPGVTEDRTLVASMSLTANVDVNLIAAFAREGRTPFEGRNRSIELKAHVPTTIDIAHEFSRRHKELKFQLSDFHFDTATMLEIKIANVALTESAESVIGRHEAEELTPRRAKLAFDEGNDSYALGIWLFLREIGVTNRYDDAIVKAAKRIGIPDAWSADALAKRLIRSPFPQDAVLLNEMKEIAQSETRLEANARIFLTKMATKLLLDQYEKSDIYENLKASEVTAALELLPNNDKVRSHFENVVNRKRSA